MSRSRRNRVEALRSRVDFLDKRIEDTEGKGTPAHFDRSERSALLWALPILEAHIEANRILHEQLKEEKDARDANEG